MEEKNFGLLLRVICHMEMCHLIAVLVMKKLFICLFQTIAVQKSNQDNMVSRVVKRVE